MVARLNSMVLQIAPFLQKRRSRKRTTSPDCIINYLANRAPPLLSVSGVERKRRTVCSSTAMSTGLDRCSSMPASRLCCISSKNAFAVMARMGMVLPSGLEPLRMARVTSRPFMTGICTSIRIMS